MRSLRPALVPLALLLLGPALLYAQDQPLAAGSDGVPVPKKKKHVQPVYPKEALAKGLRGIVILDLVIDTEGRVSETHIIRSIPGLDAAALAAARQWRYDPVKVDGKPVAVRLTVPITFALKLPEVSRDRGIPEIRQGVTPAWPESTRGGGQAAADVTLDPDGRIGLARIIEGEEPWSSALLQALRTWRFRPPPEDLILSFRVEAEFVAVSGGDRGTVRLRLSGLREAALFDAPEEEPTAVAALEPAGGPEQPVGPSTAPSPAEPAATAPAGTPSESEAPTPAKAPETPAPKTVEPEAMAAEAPEKIEPGAMAPEDPETMGPTARPSEAQVAEAMTEPSASAATPPPGPQATAAPAAPATLASAPSGETPPAEGDPSAMASAAPAGDSSAPPPVEVLRAMPPPPPPENGISAIRGVLLEPGVPDLVRGRRPVSPPFARMSGVGGEVKVDFSVGAGGVTVVQSVDGPELLRPAATQAVESWSFRRTRADRAYLSAVFTYEDDLASAVVRPQPSP